MDSTIKDLFKYPALKKELEENCETHNFDAGTVLLKEGAYAKVIPLVLEGLVKVYREDEEGNEVLLYYINPDESCVMSASSCIHNSKSEVKAVVEKTAKVLVVSAKQAEDFSRKYPVWNSFLFGLFKNKYDELLNTIQVLTFENKDKRLLTYLQNERKAKGDSTIHATHQQIANDIGSTREVVSRLLKKLENESYVKLEHKKVLLLDRS